MTLMLEGGERAPALWVKRLPECTLAESAGLVRWLDLDLAGDGSRAF